jgi:serine/threonine protein kinase
VAALLSELVEDGRVHALVTPLAESDLYAWLARSDGPLAPDTLRRWVAQVAKALWALHREGIVHRDLKPEHIFLFGDGNARLGDYGLSFIRCGAAPRSGSRTGTARPSILRMPSATRTPTTCRPRALNVGARCDAAAGRDGGG